MSKKIIPHRMIIDLNPDGTFKTGILQYRLRHNGAGDNKFYTMAIDGGISLPTINTLLIKSKEHVEIGEKIRPNVSDGRPL